jgi:RimJ/RimL family protein N-acetyltransferase
MKVLETDRLTLRQFDGADAPFVLALLNDPAWIANISDAQVRDLEAARRWIDDKLLASYARNGFGLWAVERRDDATLLGMCGLLTRETLPEIDLGYALAPAFRGAGYAREAARATLEHARDALGRRRVLAIVSPDNAPSIRVLTSLGMVSQGRITLGDDPRETELFAWSADAA